ncbi:MAG TPA: sigma-70 family RNA polymerase sigma factor [Longimicrobium sp.]
MDLERLYREHSVQLLRYLQRLSGDPELAADAVQETFMRLANRPPEGGAVRAWLYRVGTNVVIDSSRTHRRRLRILAGSPECAPLADPPLDPEAALDREERRREVQAALAALSARDRTVLLMRAEGFAHREIAATIGVSTQSVGSITLRAMKKLAAALGVKGHPEP